MLGWKRDSLSRFWKWLRKNWLVLLSHLSAAYFVLSWIIQFYSGAFYIDAVRQTTTMTGHLAITYLLLSLSCTPFFILTGWAKVIRLRRPLGLYAFGFAFLHGLTYVGWDYRFDFSLIFDTIQYQRYVIIGALAFGILLLPAITSLTKVKMQMGKRWHSFQKTVYVAAGFSVIHVSWLRKSPLETLPLIFTLALLFLFRIPFIKNSIIKSRKSLFGK